VHFLKVTQGFFDATNLVRVAQPSYSQDPALSDFWLFVHLKASLTGCTFNGSDELLKPTTAILDDVPREKLDDIFME
jgi:hypothetical protein